MSVITAKGRAIAQGLLKHFAPKHHDAVRVACSVLSRQAGTYHRIQEHDCNGTKSAAMAKREASIEARARAIVASLPPSLTGPVSVVFTGDPRGYTLRIRVPKAERDGNTWGLGGEYGVG